jgi:hypothetical protein
VITLFSLSQVIIIIIIIIIIKFNPQINNNVVKVGILFKERLDSVYSPSFQYSFRNDEKQSYLSVG